jgi:hypothetical protein
MVVTLTGPHAYAMETWNHLHVLKAAHLELTLMIMEDVYTAMKPVLSVLTDTPTIAQNVRKVTISRKEGVTIEISN